jgi:hypothetical protein
MKYDLEITHFHQMKSNNRFNFLYQPEMILR